MRPDLAPIAAQISPDVSTADWVLIQAGGATSPKTKPQLSNKTNLILGNERKAAFYHTNKM